MENLTAFFKGLLTRNFWQLLIKDVKGRAKILNLTFLSANLVALATRNDHADRLNRSVAVEN